MSLLIGFLVVSLSVTVLAVCSWRISRQEEENQLVQAYMVTLQSFYQMLQDRIEVTRRYRHDLAKRISDAGGAYGRRREGGAEGMRRLD